MLLHIQRLALEPQYLGALWGCFFFPFQDNIGYFCAPLQSERKPSSLVGSSAQELSRISNLPESCFSLAPKNFQWQRYISSSGSPSKSLTLQDVPIILCKHSKFTAFCSFKCITSWPVQHRQGKRFTPFVFKNHLLSNWKLVLCIICLLVSWINISNPLNFSKTIVAYSLTLFIFPGLFSLEPQLFRIVLHKTGYCALQLRLQSLDGAEGFAYFTNFSIPFSWWLFFYCNNFPLWNCVQTVNSVGPIRFCTELLPNNPFSSQSNAANYSHSRN